MFRDFAISVFASMCCFSLMNAAMAANGLKTDLEGYSFSTYKESYGRRYAEGSEEHVRREGIFNQRIVQIREHNAQGRSWWMGVNAFTDRTEEEMQMMRGYNRWLRAPQAGAGGIGSSALEVHSFGKSCSMEHASCTESKCCDGLVCTSRGQCLQPNKEHEHEDVELDFAETITGGKIVESQGGCGSCWAVAATSAISLQLTMNTGLSHDLSPDGMVRCTPNPHNCGGNGGCGGATAELGYDWVKSQSLRGGGVLTEQEDPYTASSSGCDYHPSQEPKSFLQLKRTQPIVNIKNYVQLPVNKAEPVFNALVESGPMVITIVAGGIDGYSGGIIDKCNNWVVDHAVLLMGYGGKKEDGTLHWKIRNSWGEHWGDKGFFKVKRIYPHETEKDKEPCGEDTNPAAGVACQDEDGKYPRSQTACGVCGVLFDSSYPVGTYVLNSGV